MKHCWHDSSSGFTLGDGSTPVRCCHCGSEGIRQSVTKLERPVGHGQLAPDVRVTTYANPEGECAGPPPPHVCAATWYDVAFLGGLTVAATGRCAVCGKLLVIHPSDGVEWTKPGDRKTDDASEPRQ